MNKFRLSVRFLRPTFFKRAGMTLSELMIAGGLGVLLIGSAVYFGMRFQQGASLDSAKSDLYEKMQVVSRQFSMDLSNAIRVKGHPDFAPAVFRVEDDVPATDPRSSTDQFDHIRMYVIHAKEFSTPIKITGPVAGQTEGTPAEDIKYAAEIFSGSDSMDEHQFNAERFLTEALDRSDIFLVSSPRASFLIEVAGFTPPSDSSIGIIEFKFRLNPDVNEVPDIDFSFSRIQAVKRVDYAAYYPDEAGPASLKRSVRHFSSGSSEEFITRDQILVKNLKQFHVNWFFADRRSELFGEVLDESGQVEPLILPLEPLSAPVYGPEPRLAWTDISAAQIDIELESEKSFSRGVSGASTATQTDEDYLPLADSMCRWADVGNPSKLICRSIDVASATDFEELLIGSDEASVGAVDCLLSDKQSRCDASCDYRFTSTDRNSSAWEGYKAGSDYCTCRDNASGGPWPGEPGFSWPSYNSANNSRLDACIRSFFVGCGEGVGPQLRSRDPRLGVACQCVHDQNKFITFSNSVLNWPPDESSGDWKKLADALLAIGNKDRTAPFDATPGGTAPHFNPWMPTEAAESVGAKFLKCDSFANAHTCLRPIRQWLKPAADANLWRWHVSDPNSSALTEATVTASNHPLIRYCGCLAFSPDETGRPNRNGCMIREDIRRPFFGRFNPTTCPNLFVTAAAYSPPTRVSNQCIETFEQGSVVYTQSRRLPNSDPDLHCRPDRQALLRIRPVPESGERCETSQANCPHEITGWLQDWAGEAVYKECRAIPNKFTEGIQPIDAPEQPVMWDFRSREPGSVYAVPSSVNGQACASVRPPGYADFWQNEPNVPIGAKEASRESIRMQLNVQNSADNGPRSELFGCANPHRHYNNGSNWTGSGGHGRVPGHCLEWADWALPYGTAGANNFLTTPTPNWSLQDADDNPETQPEVVYSATNTAFDWQVNQSNPNAPIEPENGSLKRRWVGYCRSECTKDQCYGDALTGSSTPCQNLRTALYFTRLIKQQLPVDDLEDRLPQDNYTMPNVCRLIEPPQPPACSQCDCCNDNAACSAAYCCTQCACCNGNQTCINNYCANLCNPERPHCCEGCPFTCNPHPNCTTGTGG